MSFDASSAAQSATRPGLSAELGTAVPLEHCSVYWAGMAGGVGGVGAAGGAGGAGAGGAAGTADSAALKAVAWRAPVASNEIAMTAIIASRARAVAALMAYLGICLVLPAGVWSDAFNAITPPPVLCQVFWAGNLG